LKFNSFQLHPELSIQCGDMIGILFAMIECPASFSLGADPLLFKDSEDR
jgi:hypothetical protein